jgi:fatty acid desaturase
MGTTEPNGPNNWRNWFPLLGTYLYVFVVAGLALWFFHDREGVLPWWTDIPVGLAALFLIAPAQHRLVILGQEAALGILFRNRWLNELAGDWLIHFPFSTATHHIRQHLLTHYKFTNDPDRDAELLITRRAGFWPPRWTTFLRVSAYIKWNSLRATHIFEPDPNNPYYDPERPPSKIALRIGTAYVLVTFALLLGLYFFRHQLGDEVIRDVLMFVLPSLWVLVMVVFLVLPESKFHRSRLAGVYSPKSMTLMRITFISLVNSALGWTTFLTGRSAVLNYIVLWIAPTGVALALIVWRQWRQHGDLPPGQVAWDRRPGLVGRLWFFPLNQHRHSAKHAEPRTPWYELPKASVEA